MALYDYSGLVAPRLSLFKVWYHLIVFCFCVRDDIVSEALPHNVLLVRR